MKFITLIFAGLLLSGCGQYEKKIDNGKISRITSTTITTFYILVDGKENVYKISTLDNQWKEGDEVWVLDGPSESYNIVRKASDDTNGSR